MSLLTLAVLLLTTTTAHGAVTNIGTASGTQEVNIFEIDIQFAAPSASGRVFSTGQLDGFKSDVAEAFDWYLNSSLECMGGSVGLDCDYSSFYNMETASNIQCAVTCIVPGGRSVLNVFYPVNALIDAPTRNGGREGAFAPLLLAAQNAVATRFNLDTTKMLLSEINLTAPCRSTASFSPAASASRCMGEAPLSVPLPASQHRIGSTTTFVILVSSTTDAATLKTYVCERAGLTPTTTNTQCLNNVLVTGTAFNSALVESLIDDAVAKGAAGAITANTPTTTTVTTTTSTSSSILDDSPFTIANYPVTHSFLVKTSAISNPASIPFMVANDIRSGSILSVSPPTTDYVLLFPVSIDGGSAEEASTFTVLYDRVSEAPVIGDPIIECTFNEYTWLFALFAVIVAAYLPYTMLHRSGKKKGTKKGKALIRKQEIEEQEEMAEAAQQHMSASQVGRASMNHNNNAGSMGAASSGGGGAANPPPPLTPEQMQQMQYQYAMMQQQMAASGGGQQQMMNQQYFPQQQGGGGSSSVPVTPGRQPPQQQFDFTPQARF